MPATYETLIVEDKEDGIVVVTLNRPAVRNAINTQMMHDLVDVFEPLTRDSGAVRCVILTGSGDKAFSSGGDLKERNSFDDEQWFAQHRVAQRGLAAITNSKVPVIAAVNGVAYAGGCEFAMACDFIYSRRDTTFALTEVARGIMPGGGGTTNLPRAIGERRAKEMVLTARPISAETACEWGLVNRLCDFEQLMPEALEAARAIKANAPLSVVQAKKSIHHGMQMDVRSAYVLALECYHILAMSEDRREGMAAFNEKRPANFKGH